MCSELLWPVDFGSMLGSVAPHDRACFMFSLHLSCRHLACCGWRAAPSFDVYSHVPTVRLFLRDPNPPHVRLPRGRGVAGHDRAFRMPTYTISGVHVPFPFEPYQCQLIYMEKVINSLQNVCALYCCARVIARIAYSPWAAQECAARESHGHRQDPLPVVRHIGMEGTPYTIAASLTD